MYAYARIRAYVRVCARGGGGEGNVSGNGGGVVVSGGLVRGRGGGHYTPILLLISILRHPFYSIIQ